MSQRTRNRHRAHDLAAKSPTSTQVRGFEGRDAQLFRCATCDRVGWQPTDEARALP